MSPPQCTICFLEQEDPSDPVICAHGHTEQFQHFFHESCLLDYFRSSEVWLCPYCRQAVSSDLFLRWLMTDPTPECLESVFVNGKTEILSLLLNSAISSELKKTCFILFAKYGHLEIVKRLLRENLQHGEDQVKYDLLEALFEACGNGQLEMVQELISNQNVAVNFTEDPCCPACPRESDWTPLMAAAGHLEVVKYLISCGADLNAVREYDGITPLMVAARHGQISVFRELILNGANVHVRDCDGENALMVAARHDNLDIVEELINCGLDINAEENDGRTALYIASFAGGLETVRFLLSRGANIDAGVDGNVGTALEVAAVNCRLDIVQELIRHNANVNLRSKNGSTALIVAADDYENIGVIRALLLAGADVSIANSRGDTALLTSRDSLIARELIRSGANINAANNLGQTALIKAASYGYLDMVRELISHGADIDAVDNQGLTSLKIAFEKEHMEVAHFLQGLSSSE